MNVNGSIFTSKYGSVVGAGTATTVGYGGSYGGSGGRNSCESTSVINSTYYSNVLHQVRIYF